MINNNFTKKVAEALARNKAANSFDRSIMHLEREWYTLVGLVLILLLTGGLWSVYAYKAYSKVSITGSVAEAEVSIYQSDQVSSAINYAEDRRGKYESLRGPIEKTVSAPEPEAAEAEGDTVLTDEANSTTSDATEPELIEDPAPAPEPEVEEEVQVDLAI